MVFLWCLFDTESDGAHLRGLIIFDGNGQFLVHGWVRVIPLFRRVHRDDRCGRDCLTSSREVIDLIGIDETGRPVAAAVGVPGLWPL